MTVTDTSATPGSTIASNAVEPSSQPKPGPVRSKLVAALLGLVFGTLGLHRRYLGQAYWWLMPVACLPLLGHAMREEVWFRAWSFHVLAVLVAISWLQTIIISLTPTEKFNARFNAGRTDVPQAGTVPVLIAIVALMLGTTLLMAVMALALEGIFMARGS